MKFHVSVAVLFVMTVVFLPAQNTAPSAGELVYPLSSPEYLGGGALVTRTRSPQGVYLNPASAAGFQRTVLDVNYANLQGFSALGGSADGTGHAVNVAVSVPFKAGVFTTTLGFLDTSAYTGTAMDLGTSARLGLTFSKELYSDLWIGAGINGSIGEVDDRLQGGGALSFGFLHFPKTFGAYTNFRWGASLTGLGYGLGSGSRGYLDAIPGNITPAVGVAFDLIDTGKFRWEFRGDVRSPSVTDLKVAVGNDLYFGNVLRMSVASALDVRDAFEGGWQTVIPSVALAVNFPLGGDKPEQERTGTTEIDIQAAAAPLYDGVWAFAAGVTMPFGVRDSKPPLIAVDYQSPQYISPNYDGVQDELLIPFTVTDERYITRFALQVSDESGRPVRTFLNKDERPENETVKNLWSRTVSPKVGTPVPDSFRWDGVSESGSLAPDGTYEVRFEFADDNGNTSAAGPFTVIVDTVAPELELTVPEGLDLIFSPDGDGFKDTLTVEQTGSTEHLWESGFLDASDNPVRGWAWADAAPDRTVWDGKNEGGEAVPDGVYRYSIASTDRAGNAVARSIDGIIIDTRRPGIGISINRAVFSPGTESRISSVTLTPDIPVRTGIVDWSVEIVDSEGNAVNSWTRRESPAVPESLDFNGFDRNGQRLAEGRYTGRLKIEYSNGFRPEAMSPNFTVDVTPPSATVVANWDVFSPQSGSVRDRVELRQTVTAEETWAGILTDSGGRQVNGWTWISEAQNVLVWDGRDADGRLVADGVYSYHLESVDRAGNAGRSESVLLTIDTSSVEASVTSSLDVFGPTGNGVRDTVTLFMTARTDSAVSDWSLAVRDDGGRDIRAWNGSGTPPDSVIWNGRNTGGSAASDGVYRAFLTVNYVKGVVAEASTGGIRIDTKPPVIEARIDNGLFSPDGDGSRDVVTVNQKSSPEPVFEGAVLDSSGRSVATRRWTGELTSFEWDGRDDTGNLLPDGDYIYVVSGTDEAGNLTRTTLRGIRIDTAPTPVYLTANLGFIRAGETDRSKHQTFAAVVPNTRGVTGWDFRISGENGTTVHTRTGTGAVPDGFTWNGTDDRGRPVEGVFTGYLTVNYDKGSRPRAESRPFVSDGSPPQVNITVEPRPFSPDADNVDDEVVIGLAVEDRSRISDWNLEIFDPRDRVFISFSGRGRPSERIIWDGRSGRGELVESAEDYPYVLSVTDVLGHTAVVRGEIPVDVLVIREGNRLKIQINNITFQPNLPELTLTGEEGAKNVQVLDRLAQIMQKYGSYRIVVEGHAVSLNWANPAAAEREQRDILIPLSRSRAQTVVNELARRGISPARLSAEGIGGARPIVPHGDVEERWRNRRVEFYLEK